MPDFIKGWRPADLQMYFPITLKITLTSCHAFNRKSKLQMLWEFLSSICHTKHCVSSQIFTLLILLADPSELWPEPTTRWMSNWINCSRIWTSPSIMSSNLIPLEGRFAQVAFSMIALKMKAIPLISWSSFDFWRSGSFKGNVAVIDERAASFVLFFVNNYTFFEM